MSSSVNNLPLMAKITGVFALILTILLIMSGVSYKGMQSIKLGSDETYEDYLISIVDLATAEAALRDLFILQKAHIIAPDDNAMEQAEAGIQEASEKLTAALESYKLKLDPGKETTAFNALLDKLDDLLALNAKIINLSSSNQDDVASELSRTGFRSQFDALAKDAAILQKANVDGAEDQDQKNEATYSNATTVMATITISAIVLLGLFWCFSGPRWRDRSVA